MIRMSVLYPNGDGTTFDHDYYRDKHVPMAVATWEPVSAEIDRGLNGPYVAAVHFTFASIDDMKAALALEASAAITADVPNYTNATPVLQTSEIAG
jgi:uncharacterized protein (TIGR02118 family)